MNKIGSTLVLYNSNGFSSAFKSLQTKYLSYLSESEQKILEQFDKVVETKSKTMETVVDVLDKAGVKRVNLEITRNGKSSTMHKTAIVDRLPDGTIKESRNLFGLTTELENFQNATILTAADNTFDAYWQFPSLKKLVVGATEYMSSSYRNMLTMKKSAVDVFQKYFDVKKVIDIGVLVEDEKLRRKNNRKAAFKGDRVEAADAKIIRYLKNGYWSEVSYNELKTVLAGMPNVTPVLCIRDNRTKGDRNYYAEFTEPTDKASEKTFQISDIRINSIYSGVRTLTNELQKYNDYAYIEVTPGAYKRLKLWRDADFVTEKEVITDLLTSLASSVTPLTIHNYTDSLLEGDNSDRKEVESVFKKYTSDADKNTKFYKRLEAALNVIKEDEKLLESPDYVVFEKPCIYRTMSELNIASPITKKTVVPEIFADYPMLKYFSADWNGNRIRIHDYESDKNIVEDIMAYVRLVESK